MDRKAWNPYRERAEMLSRPEPPEAAPRKRWGAHRITRWGLGVLLALVCLGVFFYFCTEPILRLAAQSRLRSATGLDASIGDLEIKEGGSAVRVRDLRLSSPPGFGTAPLLDVAELYAYWDWDRAKEGVLRLKQLRLSITEIHVVKDARGQLNVASMVKAASMTNEAPGRTRSPRRIVLGQIDLFSLSFGRIVYTDMQRPANSRVLEVNIRDEQVENLGSEEELNNWLWSFAFRVVLQQWMENPDQLRGKWLQSLLDGFAP